MRADDPAGSLPAADRELFAQARETLQTAGRPGRNSVAAAVRAAKSTYVGLDLISRKSSICAEPAAISAAQTAGDDDLQAIVAVCFRPATSQFVTISPCGACRELMAWHAPECRVVFEYQGALVQATARDLFQYPAIFG
jgi:cytidine deaminase